MAIKLNAEIRKVAGKGAARAVRKNQNIPAVIYGEKKEPVSYLWRKERTCVYRIGWPRIQYVVGTTIFANKIV